MLMHYNYSSNLLRKLSVWATAALVPFVRSSLSLGSLIFTSEEKRMRGEGAKAEMRKGEERVRAPLLSKPFRLFVRHVVGLVINLNQIFSAEMFTFGGHSTQE